MKGLIAKSALQAFAILLAGLFLAKTSQATTAIMLSDEELIVSSRVILLGEVVSTKAQWNLNHDNINTYVKVKVLKVVKGLLQNEHIVFRQLGGVVGEESTVIFGAPEYKAGRRVLLFLDTARDGTLRVAQLFQGKYDVVDDSRTGAARVERKVDKGAINLLGASEGSDITNTSTLSRFTKKIKRVLRARAADVSALDAAEGSSLIVETPPEYIDDAAQGPSPGDVTPQYTFLGSYRWFEPDTGQPVIYRINPASAPIAGGGTSEINQAFAAWTNVTTTALVLQNGGSTTMFGFRQDGVSAISYDDPLDQMSDPVGCSGTLALGGVTSAGGGTRVIGGLTFSHIFEGDVVFNRNFACFLGVSSNLAEVATHEIGHSIGFGHSADAAATMYATAHGGGRGATLGSDDVAAVSFLYPGSKGAPPPVPPAAPGGLSASVASSSAINLNWVDNSNNEDGFRLERKTGVSGVYAPVATPGAGQVSYSDSGLSASTTYYYRIKAYNSAGESAYSDESSATTSPAATSNNAAFISQSVPSTLGAGQSAAVSITMRNSGTSTWVPGTYFLGSQNPQGNATWGLSRVNLASSVAPGSDATFTFSVTAPSLAGSYNFQWAMLQNTTSFGGFSTNVPITVTSGGGGGGTSDNAAFVSQFVPTSMTPGQSYTVTITMRNTGTSTWSPSTGYRLGSQNPQDNLTWGLNRVSLLGSVAPGTSTSIKFTVRAPSTSGVYNFQWQMVKDGAGFFGGLTQNLAIQVGSGGGATNGASFVSQSVPSSLGAGQAAFVSVTMRNSGTTTWTPGTYFLGSQNPQDNATWGLSRVNLASSVAPGSDATFTFSVTAPSLAGSYNFQWAMLQSGVGYFGFASANVAIAVSGGGGGGGINDATFISQNVPTSMSAGQAYTVSVTMRNSGSTTWGAGAYKLTSQNPAGNLTWGVSQMSLPASVAPGSDATFTFNVTAPSTAGTYGFQWRMFQDTVGYFGAFTPSVGVSVSSSAPPTGSPMITTASIAYGTRNVPYSQQLNAQGGSLPYQWSVTSGSLPAGLLLNGSTGLISGTPVVGGTFSFTVTVTDRNGSRASQSYKTLIR
ncbi:MAG TPA: NBR1-Ig-like domain-containing protein [Blastocatellia bacterium]|jgi:hypothetical protein